MSQTVCYDVDRLGLSKTHELRVVSVPRRKTGEVVIPQELYNGNKVYTSFFDTGVIYVLSISVKEDHYEVTVYEPRGMPSPEYAIFGVNIGDRWEARLVTLSGMSISDIISQFPGIVVQEQRYLG